MRRISLRDADGTLVQGGLELVGRWRDQPDARIWLDIEGEPSAEEFEFLAELGVHELALQDASRSRHPPKLEEFADNTFVLFRGLTSIDEKLEFEPQQLGFFIGHRYLVTMRRGLSLSIQEYWQHAELAAFMEKPELLAISVLHYSSGRYLEAVLEFEHRLSELEDIMTTTIDDEPMKELVNYRSRLRRLRRVFNYHDKLAQRLLAHMQEREYAEGESIIPEAQNLTDRCDRLLSLCSMYYDICGDLIDGYLSLSSHQLNQTMRILTLITAIFVPMTFMAGIYGMNFENMPELRMEYAYFVLLGVMAVTGVALLLLFRHKRWL